MVGGDSLSLQKSDAEFLNNWGNTFLRFLDINNRQWSLVVSQILSDSVAEALFYSRSNF